MAELSVCLGVTSGVGGRPSCALLWEASWCVFLVGEEVQDQSQPMTQISMG